MGDPIHSALAVQPDILGRGGEDLELLQPHAGGAHAGGGGGGPPPLVAQLPRLPHLLGEGRGKEVVTW